MDHEARDAIARLKKQVETLEQQLETASGLVATTAAMAITNSTTLSILAVTHREELGKNIAHAHAEQRRVLIDLLREAGVELQKIEELNTLTNKAIEDHLQHGRYSLTPFPK